MHAQWEERGLGLRKRETKSPALGRAFDARSQIRLADCIMLGRCDERVTDENRKPSRLTLDYPLKSRLCCP